MGCSASVSHSGENGPLSRSTIMRRCPQDRKNVHSLDVGELVHDLAMHVSIRVVDRAPRQ